MSDRERSWKRKHNKAKEVRGMGVCEGESVSEDERETGREGERER